MARKIYVYHTGMVAMHGGGRKAVLDSYMYLFQYRYDTLKGSRQRWVCAEKHCKVSVITDEDLNVTKEPTTHFHDAPDAAICEANMAKALIKISAKVSFLVFWQRLDDHH